MPQDYFSLVTNQGLIKEAASNEPGGTAIDLNEMAVGDSSGAYYDPDGSEIALANEVHRVNLTHVVVDENNTNQLIVEAVLDETIGPFYIREVGIFDSNGDLFAIGKYPETFKPNLPAGSGKRLYIRMILGFANSPNVNLAINNDIALDPNFGTDVNNALAERLIKTNNLSDLDDVVSARSNLDLGSAALANNATETERGIAQIATQAIANTGTNDTDFLTSLKLAELFRGMICAYISTTIPSGWLECNGVAISRTTYSALFAKIGTQFGIGDGSTTFNLPDLRGEFIRGFDNGRTVDNGRSFASFQSDELKSHSHDFRQNKSYASLFNPVRHDHIPMGVSIPPSDTQTSTNGIIYNTGGSETRPRNIALVYCIKY